MTNGQREPDKTGAKATAKDPAKAVPPAAGVRLTHRRASTIKVEPPVWLWPRWLVAAAVQLLVGRQGTGKSTFAAWVVAQLSTGRPWPDEPGSRPARRCGMLSLEEPADRLVARLKAVGADLDLVEILGHVNDRDVDGRPYQRPWRLPGDCAALEATGADLGLAVVTIDGLGQYSVSGDSHNLRQCRSGVVRPGRRGGADRGHHPRAHPPPQGQL